MLTRLVHPLNVERSARLLYARIVQQARRTEFYTAHDVPDTLDGRFEMIALHTFLVLHRLKRMGAEPLAQALFDVLFLDMDENLREMGVGDLSVGKRVKQMIRAFYGRIAAYEAGLEAAPGALEAALERNLYGTVRPSPEALAGMAAYLRREAAALAGQDGTMLSNGILSFGVPSGAEIGRQEITP